MKMQKSKGEPYKKDIKASLFQIQRFSVHDGNGIRTTIFFKGCPLNCLWCSNPESWNPEPDEKYGFHMSPDELWKEIQKDEIFYRESGGGISFSGGEPLRQAEFIRGILAKNKRLAYDTAIETSAYFSWDKAKDIIPLLDTIFVDLKIMDPHEHKKYTGKDNKIILENIGKMAQCNNNIIVRIPLIKEVNANSANILKTCQFIEKTKTIKSMEFLLYHELASGKYKSLDLEFKKFTAPSHEELEELKKIVKNFDIKLLNP